MVLSQVQCLPLPTTARKLPNASTAFSLMSFIVIQSLVLHKWSQHESGGIWSLSCNSAAYYEVLRQWNFVFFLWLSVPFSDTFLHHSVMRGALTSFHLWVTFSRSHRFQMRSNKAKQFLKICVMLFLCGDQHSFVVPLIKNVPTPHLCWLHCPLWAGSLILTVWSHLVFRKVTKHRKACSFPLCFWSFKDQSESVTKFR